MGDGDTPTLPLGMDSRLLGNDGGGGERCGNEYGDGVRLGVSVSRFPCLRRGRLCLRRNDERGAQERRM